jgi:hypothetical protein
VVHAYNTDVGEGAYEVDDDSDYEEEPATRPTEARTDGSVEKGNVPSHTILPGAFTT